MIYENNLSNIEVGDFIVYVFYSARGPVITLGKVSKIEEDRTKVTTDDIISTDNQTITNFPISAIDNDSQIIDKFKYKRFKKLQELKNYYPELFV